MPRPEGVIDGIIKLQKLITEDKAYGWIKYQKNLDWYRENQKKVIKNWNMPDYNW
jgi:NADH-quinone oxidoreductase subunit B